MRFFHSVRFYPKFPYNVHWFIFSFEATIDETTIKLPIPPEVKDPSGVARLAVISYQAESALTKEAFDALAMATVSFFSQSGQKIRGKSKGLSSSFPLPRPIELSFPALRQQAQNVNGSQPKCVFYDLHKLKWSPKGCQLNEAETGNPSQSTEIARCCKNFSWMKNMDSLHGNLGLFSLHQVLHSSLFYGTHAICHIYFGADSRSQIRIHFFL